MVRVTETGWQGNFEGGSSGVLEVLTDVLGGGANEAVPSSRSLAKVTSSVDACETGLGIVVERRGELASSDSIVCTRCDCTGKPTQEEKSKHKQQCIALV